MKTFLMLMACGFSFSMAAQAKDTCQVSSLNGDAQKAVVHCSNPHDEPRADLSVEAALSALQHRSSGDSSDNYSIDNSFQGGANLSKNPTNSEAPYRWNHHPDERP